MSEIILSSSNALSVPQPKEQLTFRLGNAGDFGFIDELQTVYNKQLGFMPTKWLEGKVKAGQILIAEEVSSCQLVVGSEDKILPTTNNKLPTKLGYIIAQDRYLKRDELGIVYQLCVKPGRQRGFIGAALLKAQFDRSAPGCRLYCCWCAQDIEANQFWESMGYVPLAYRNGSETKGKNGGPRVQIFWEKKIRGNQDNWHWWYPCKTDQGAMRADRLALPIPPGVHWSELRPIEIPEMKQLEGDCPQSPGEQNGGGGRGRPPSRKKIETKSPIVHRPQWGVPDLDEIPPVQVEPELVLEPLKERAKRIKKPKIKIDPVFAELSRELRDKYLEQVNEKGYRLESAGKYELTRGIGEAMQWKDVKRLAA